MKRETWNKETNPRGLTGDYIRPLRDGRQPEIGDNKMSVHIYKPKVISSSYRVLPKYCRKFVKQQFEIFHDALNYGFANYKQGFRIFRQYCYEWHEPINQLVAKIEGGFDEP